MNREVTVLLVEDNVVDVQAVRRAFHRQRIGNPIEVARDGVEALAWLQLNAALSRPKPHLVLLDLNMPRMDGLELLENIRADPDLSRTIVFVLTTSKRDEDRAAAYDQHVAGYIAKSNVGPDFARLVELLGCYWKIVELPPEPSS